jgi:hypothetical protein
MQSIATHMNGKAKKSKKGSKSQSPEPNGHIDGATNGAISKQAPRRTPPKTNVFAKFTSITTRYLRHNALERTL